MRKLTATAACLAIAAALLTAACGGSSHPKPTPTTTATAGIETPLPATPTAAPASPTPVTLPSAVAGKPLKQLIPGPPIEFPEHLVMYVAITGCFNCGGGAGDLWRIYRARDAQLTADHIEPPGNASVYSLSPDGATIIAVVCTGYCGGGEGNVSEESVAHLVQSQDGGITWGPLSDRTFERTVFSFAGWYGTELVVNAVKYLPNNNIESHDAFLLPSFARLTPPSSFPATGEAAQLPYAFVGPNNDIFWTTYEAPPPIVLDGNGKAFGYGALESIIPGLEWRDQTFLESAYQGTSDVWFPVVPGAGGYPSFFVEVDAAGTPVRGFATSISAVTFGAKVDANTWLGTAAADQVNERAVLIDATTGMVHAIFGLPSYVSPIPGNFAFPRLALTGNFWRVDAGGDCLNVRQEASASSPSLGCFASGVLLRERDSSAAQGWKAITTPDGRAGFAASEFLK
jgi:hypothetical protein